jgi:translation elongation factor EF-Ts
MERCLVDQPFIRDPEGKLKVKDVVAAAQTAAGEPVGIVGFARLRLGDGVERRAAE